MPGSRLREAEALRRQSRLGMFVTWVIFHVDDAEIYRNCGIMAMLL
jgi:hypothetical protein